MFTRSTGFQPVSSRCTGWKTRATQKRFMPRTTSKAKSIKQPDTTWRSLIRAFGLVRRVMEPYFAQHGISGSQWGMLRVLHNAESQGQPALRLGDLSDRLLIRPPSVTGNIDRLIRSGLVRRASSEEDHRVK